MANVEDSTLFGGKPYPKWQEGDFSLPGYQNAIIEFTKVSNSSEKFQWGFLISPSSLTIQHSNDVQVNKTMAGWFFAKGGPGLGNLSFSGYMLDTLQSPEKLRFMDIYHSYIKDKQNNYMEFYNDYKQIITIEGISYSGVIQNIQLSKSGNQNFIYQYSITMMFYHSSTIYAINDSLSMTREAMKKQMGLTKANTKAPLTSVNSSNSIQMSEGVASILQGKSPV